MRNRFKAMMMLALACALNADAGTLIFPPTSTDPDHCGQDRVPNGCGIVVFSGGHFVTPSGTSSPIYVGGYSFPSCVSGQVGWSFMNGSATAVTITMRNGAFR